MLTSKTCVEQMSDTYKRFKAHSSNKKSYSQTQTRLRSFPQSDHAGKVQIQRHSYKKQNLLIERVSHHRDQERQRTWSERIRIEATTRRKKTVDFLKASTKSVFLGMEKRKIQIQKNLGSEMVRKNERRSRV